MILALLIALIAIVTVVMAALGGHVSSDSPGLRYMFWVLALIAISLMGVQSYQNQKEKQEERALTQEALGHFIIELSKQNYLLSTNTSTLEDVRRGSQLDESKVKLFVKDAYIFDNYLGSTKDDIEHASKIINPTKPLRKKFAADVAVPLSFGIVNKNARKPLQNAILHIKFLDAGIEIVNSGGWETQTPNKYYAMKFMTDVNNTGFMQMHYR